MHPTRRKGFSKGEVLLFLVVLGLGMVIFICVNQKPTVVERTIVIEKEAPAPPPPVVKPAPVEAAQPASVKMPPEPTVQLPETVVIITPPEPACIAMEKKLRIAQQVAIQVNKDIAAARQAALKQFRHSSDYLSMMADLEQK